MTRLLTLLFLLVLAACDSAPPGTATTDDGPATTLRAASGTVTPELDTGVLAAKRSKGLVCHVGSETGPAGEAYDPACVPGDANGWFCPDAGKVDLIEVADPAKHMANPAHVFGGVSDYEPLSAGATGVGKEDSDGDGIDDGCETEPVCPCWDESELLAVTEANLSPDACSAFVGTSGSARAIFSDDDLFPVGYVADPFDVGIGPWCGLLYPVQTSQQISTAEAETCVAQIEARCAEIEGPGPNGVYDRATARTRR